MPTAISQIGNYCTRVITHTLMKEFQGVSIESLIAGIADEIFSSNHESLTIETCLEGDAKLARRMAFTLFDGTGINLIQGDDTVVDMSLSSSS